MDSHIDSHIGSHIGEKRKIEEINKVQKDEEALTDIETAAIQ